MLNFVAQEELMRRLLLEKQRRLAIARNPHIGLTHVPAPNVEKSPAVAQPILTYTATREDVVMANYTTTNLIDEVLALLKTVNEGEKEMRKRILHEITQYIQEPKDGKGS